MSTKADPGKKKPRSKSRAATISTINTAFNSPNAVLRKRAAADLRARGIDIEYMKVPASA